MYIIKNAFKNITRQVGRNILIGIIITTITVLSCISISINKSGETLVNKYKNDNPLKVTLRLNTMNFRNATDEVKNDFELLNLDTIEQIGDSDDCISYYYTLTNYLNSDSIEKIDYEELFKKPDDAPNNMPEMPRRSNRQNGDYKVVAYSDISYNEDFINGNKKIIDGEMIKDEESKIIISEELAEVNDLKVGSVITFKNVNDENITYDLEVVGIYSSNSEDENPMESSNNQIYASTNLLNKIINDNGEVSSFEQSNNINAVYYIESENIDSFTENIRYIGVSEYYEINTNEDEILASLKPINNITSFSATFLIIVIITGAVILTIVNLFNIRERKYEIGVLRAIGMTKTKVTMQLVLEILFNALVSLIIGIILGFFLSQPITNNMLKSEIESIKSETQEQMENFGGKGDFKRPMDRNVEYIDSLDVNMDLITILELFGVSILLTIISGTGSVMYVNKYEPNKILQNRN